MGVGSSFFFIQLLAKDTQQQNCQQTNKQTNTPLYSCMRIYLSSSSSLSLPLPFFSPSLCSSMNRTRIKIIASVLALSRLSLSLFPVPLYGVHLSKPLLPLVPSQPSPCLGWYDGWLTHPSIMHFIHTLHTSHFAFAINLDRVFASALSFFFPSSLSRFSFFSIVCTHT